ncbi:MAG: hypothetical protein KAW91_03030 [candidate division Zixibacteria bacterium]|nr:hypothetical protein [candidate division Zixibacteria bacterium]MCK4607414.1 hypothetical protein [candidate division Zixibacteria bacterium]
MEHFALWLSAFLTLGILSFLYKDNPWYKLSEAVFVGISAGFWFVTLFWDNLVGKFWDGWQDEPMLWVGAVLGFLMLLRLVPRIGWISRWPLAFIVGATSGLWLMNYLASNIMVQVQATIQSLLSTSYASGYDAGWGAMINSLVIVVGTFTGLVYFYFSKEHKGAFGGAARVGIFFIMITFGASFGYTVMSRMSLLIGRIDFLLGDWLGLIN